MLVNSTCPDSFATNGPNLLSQIKVLLCPHSLCSARSYTWKLSASLQDCVCADMKGICSSLPGLIYRRRHACLDSPQDTVQT